MEKRVVSFEDIQDENVKLIPELNIALNREQAILVILGFESDGCYEGLDESEMPTIESIIGKTPAEAVDIIFPEDSEFKSENIQTALNNAYPGVFEMLFGRLKYRK